MCEFCREIRPGDLTLRDITTENFLIDNFPPKINMSPKGGTIFKGNFIFPTINFFGDMLFFSRCNGGCKWVRG